MNTTAIPPLRVSTHGAAGSYIFVLQSQLDQVTAALRENKVCFWVDEETISLNGNPEVTVINLEPGSNPVQVQAILDKLVVARGDCAP